MAMAAEEQELLTIKKLTLKAVAPEHTELAETLIEYLDSYWKVRMDSMEDLIYKKFDELMSMMKEVNKNLEIIKRDLGLNGYVNSR